jgi:AraC-like DNA-binding protein
MKTADVLSDVLRTVRLTGAVYFDLELSSPWVADTPPAREIAGIVMPGAERVVEYHVIARGSCWARVADQPARHMAEGDLLIIPQGDAHVLSSAPGMSGTPDRSLWVRPSAALPIVYELGGGGQDRARLVCGFLGFDERPFNPLIAGLPSAIHLPSKNSGDHALAALVQMAVTESRTARPGGENVLARLSELMFVEAIRRYLEGLPEADRGWLAGLRDPVVGQALAALHGDARQDWTVESLARAAGASRSVLAERFTALVGLPPMQYLALWRMQVASRLLRDGGQVATVADAVGYESEAAFSRAFKKLVGESPAMWRRRADERAAQSLVPSR